MAMDLNDACRSFVRTLPDGFDRLAVIYGRMDAAYAAVAGHYGFICNGCEDNCCRTRFRHHTLIEYAYLQKGFAGLDSVWRRAVGVRAREYRQALQAAETASTPFRHWCPLNHEGRCILYAFRPMICRLHGLPHHLRHPVRGLIQGPGCHVFEAQCPAVPARPLDRSNLYKSLAGLEQAARQITATARRSA
jgi:Fe-S-cluster containining protein